MAKYDPDRINETAAPYAPGTSGIEPLCDEFGRAVMAPGSGGGGGDASAANQVLALTALDSIYDALVLVGTEATSVQIRDAVTSLGNGATLSDLAAALTPLATEATVAQIRDALAGVSTELTSQAILSALGPLATSLDVQAVQTAIADLGDGSTIDDVVTALVPLATAAKQDDILTALQAQGIDVASIKSSIDLLVPDLDAVRVAVEATNAKIPASPAQDRTTAAAPSATRASNGTSFIDLALDATVTLVKTAVEAVRDRLPAAFTSGGGVKTGLVDAIPAGSNTIGKTDQGAAAAVGGAWSMRIANAGASAFVTPFVSGDTVDTELPPAAALSDVMSNPTAPAVGAWLVALNPGTGQGNRMPGISTTGLFIQGATNAGSAVSQRPVTVGGVDGGGNVRNLLVDTSSRQVIVGAATSGSAVAGAPALIGGSDGTNARTIATDTSGRPNIVGAAASGAAVAGNPVLMGGSDGVNAQSVNVDSTGAIRLQSGGPAGSAAPSRVTQIGGSDGTSLRALSTDSAGRPNINIVSPLGIQAPATSVGIVAAKGLRPAATDTIPAAAASRVLVAGPGRLVELHYRYTGAGTKYIVLLDQAALPAVASNWIGWYDTLTNGSGREIFEFLTPIDFVNGITVGVTATEPVAGTPIVLSTNAAEFFSVPFFQYQ